MKFEDYYFFIPKFFRKRQLILFIFLVNFDKISENVNKTLELKQNEFNFLLETKDQEIKLLSEEVFKINENMELIKRDRIRDHKLLNDYETQNNFLSQRIKEINDKFIDGLGLMATQKEKERRNFNISLEVTKLIFLIY